MKNDDIISRYTKTALEIAEAMKKKYKNTKTHIISTNKDTGDKLLVVEGNNFITGFSVIEDNDSYCIKIEDFFTFDEHGRKVKYNDLHKDLVLTCMLLAEEYNAPLGIWVGMNDEIEYEFYEKLGFKYIESIRDRWMRYK